MAPIEAQCLDGVDQYRGGCTRGELRKITQENCFINPVLTVDGPDPAVLFIESLGKFMMVTTQCKREGTWIHMPIYESDNLVDGWRFVGDGMRRKPQAIGEKQDYWAYDVVRRQDGKYVATMSARLDPKVGIGHGMGIFMGSSDSPWGNFDWQDTPIIGGKEDWFSCIDSKFVFNPEDGKHYMVYGSGFNEISLVRLDKSLMKLDQSFVERKLLEPDPRLGLSLVEAAHPQYQEDALPDRKWMMTVAGSDYLTNYYEALAVAPHLLGPWKIEHIYLEDNCRIDRGGHHGRVVRDNETIDPLISDKGLSYVVFGAMMAGMPNPGRERVVCVAPEIPFDRGLCRVGNIPTEPILAPRF